MTGGEWLDVVPWILGAMALGVSYVVFSTPSVTTQAPMAQVIDLAEFKRRRALLPFGSRQQSK